MTSQAQLAWQRVQEVCKEADPQPNPPNIEYILYPDYERELLQACQAAVAAGNALRSSHFLVHRFTADAPGSSLLHHPLCLNDAVALDHLSGC